MGATHSFMMGRYTKTRRKNTSQGSKKHTQLGKEKMLRQMESRSDEVDSILIALNNNAFETELDTVDVGTITTECELAYPGINLIDEAEEDDEDSIDLPKDYKPLQSAMWFLNTNTLLKIAQMSCTTISVLICIVLLYS